VGVAVSENRTGTCLSPFPFRAAALCLPCGSISFTNLLLLYLHTMGNPCDPLQSLSPLEALARPTCPVEGQCVEPVPHIWNAQIHGQRGKKRGK